MLLSGIVAVHSWHRAHESPLVLLIPRRADFGRMKVLVHDGVGIWLAARRLNPGKFNWPAIHRGLEVNWMPNNFKLVLGLP
ncbi:IS66 family insertion sequence element accessory protein TnpB [Pseudomonas lini]